MVESPKDTFWLLKWTLLVLCLVALPYVVVTLLRPPGSVFLGSLLNTTRSPAILISTPLVRTESR